MCALQAGAPSGQCATHTHIYICAAGWCPEWTEALMRQGAGQWGRFHRVTLAPLRDCGARYFAWLPPGEVMLDGEGKPLARQPEQPRRGA